MSADKHDRAVDKIVRLAAEPTDLVSFWRACTEVVDGVVPHFWAPCFYTMDPATLLVTSHFHEGLDEFPAESLAEEYYGDDVHKLADIARSEAGISTLHEVTGGDPSGSPRWQANMEMGGDQEMIARLNTKAGETWGALGLYREPGAPMFDQTDKRFVLEIAPHLAMGARRAMLLGEATDPETPDSPGLLMLDAGWTVQSATPGVERWLDELLDGDLDGGRLPAAVQSVAAQAMRDDSPGVSFARVVSRSGQWLLLHGARLTGPGERRVAVIIEPAHPARIYPLLMSAYGLTERERDVVRLLLHGASTTEIAEQLVVSPHTVTQHLKSVFDKTGMRSRRDLIGKIFFTHYEPRLRDNEERVRQGRPLRGGPVSQPGSRP